MTETDQRSSSNMVLGGDGIEIRYKATEARSLRTSDAFREGHNSPLCSESGPEKAPPQQVDVIKEKRRKSRDMRDILCLDLGSAAW